jgi:hypothetical protein
MDLLELKIITFGDITANQNLTKAEKLQLLNFVKECTDFQLVGLVETGRMYTDKELLLQEQKSLSDKAINWAAKNHPAPSGGVAGIPEIDRALKKKAVERGLERAKERYAAGETPAQKKAAEPSLVDKASAKGQEAIQAVGGAGNAAAIAALSVGAITAGVLAYKRFFSKAARACKDKSGKEKSACMRSYKAQGKQAEIGVLTAKLSSCKNNPKCINRIKARIVKAKGEVQALKSKK